MDDVSSLRRRISGLTVGVLTDDFSLIHDLSLEFEKMGCTLVPLYEGEAINKDLDCLILQKGKEAPPFVSKGPPTVGILPTPEMTADRSIACSMGKFNPNKMVIGVDPGRRPGMAFLADGTLIKTLSAMKPEMVGEIIDEKISAYLPKKSLVRLGIGDPKNRDVILSSIESLGIPIEMVDERRTTRGTRNRDQNAAAIIARTLGNRIDPGNYWQR